MIQKHMTVKEVATTLRRTPQTILRWINEGKVFNDDEYVKVYDGYLFKETAIQRILKENTSCVSA